MNRTELPDGFTQLQFDARRPLPLRAAANVEAGALAVTVVATPSDLNAVYDHDLDTPWIETSSWVEPAEPVAVPWLQRTDRSVLEVTRPMLVASLDRSLIWSGPVVTGRVVPIVDHSGAGLVAEVYVARCDLRVASLVRFADVGSTLVIGYRDPTVGVEWNHADPPAEEAVYGTLV